MQLSTALIEAAIRARRDAYLAGRFADAKEIEEDLERHNVRLTEVPEGTRWERLPIVVG